MTRGSIHGNTYGIWAWTLESRTQMSALDTFESFNASLTKAEREQIKEFIKAKTDELLAARSEDARVRLVQEYFREVRELLLEEK